MFQYFKNVRINGGGYPPPIILFLHIYLITMHTSEGDVLLSYSSRESTVGQNLL